MYQLGLALVALAMLLLPCLYVALTVAMFWSVYWFATHCFAAIWAWPIGHSMYVMIVKIVCSVTPILAGSVAGFALIKPLFARRVKPMQPVALNPEIDHRLFELVQSICQLLGAPAPSRINLNCSLNASASFENGWSGFFRHRLVLTLGLPLVAGLTQREFAGVIAHEFGHFRQGFGMRVSYLIRFVNGWFARVVYERDSWDEMLAEAAADSEGWARFMVAGAEFGVWLSRSVLWLLMMAGHSISALLSRHMEYDADAAEIELAGSDAFESTTLKLATLGSIWTDLHLDMRRSWGKRFQLPDNLPVLMDYRARTMPAEKRERIENKVGLSRTGLLDTHPSAADRVKNARRLARTGYEISDEPAPELFENFNAVSQMITLAYYEDDLEVPTTDGFLIPVETIIRGLERPQI